MAVGSWEDVVVARKRARHGLFERGRRGRREDQVEQAVRAEAIIRELQSRAVNNELLLLYSGLRPPVAGL